MATYTSNYAWTKPEGSDPVDITVLNNNLDSQDNIVHNAYMQLAPVFSTASVYAVDDVVLYANNLYKCITAVTVAGAWDSAKWTQVKVSDICGGGGGGGTSDYSQLTNLPSVNDVTLLGNKTSADLGLQDAIQIDTMPTASATYDGKIVQFVGTTTASYTHGYYYECVENGGVYSWVQTNVQPGSGQTLQAGDYIDISNGIISVTKEIGDYDYYKYELTAKIAGSPYLEVKKYINNALASTTNIPNDGQLHNVDDMMTIGYTYGIYTWDLTLLEDSVEHDAGYTESWSYQDSTPRIVNFEVAVDPSTTLVARGDVDDLTPTFTTAQSRNNLVSGEKLSIMLGKISKFFNDLKTVAFTGSFSDLSNKPKNANTFQGTIAEWNQLTTAEKKAYDHASIPDSLDGDVTFPSSKVTYGNQSVEDALDGLEKHSYNGQYVVITSYTDANNPYIAPTDGYARVTSGSIRFGTASANINLISSSETVAVFVRKGTPLYVVPSSSSTTSAHFISLS